MPYVGPNTFTIGAMYDPPPGFTQPDGVGTQVFPAQVTGGGPISIEPTTEQSGFFSYGCSHQVNSPKIFWDVDMSTGEQVVLVTCPLCTYVQRTMTPEEFADPIGSAIIVP